MKFLRSVDAAVPAATVVLALGLSGGVAIADSPTRKGLAVGEDVWGDHCPGTVDVEVGELPRGTAARAIELYGPKGERSGCRIVLSDDSHWYYEKTCTVIVHEHGHFAGAPHSDDPDSVMYPKYRKPYHRCRR